MADRIPTRKERKEAGRKARKRAAAGAAARKKLLIALMVVLAAAAGLSACLYATRPEIVRLQVGTNVFTVDTARTEEERNIGLSGRDSLAPDGGMLFVYASPARPSFWMRGTGVPLDLAFLGNDGSILELHQLTPHSETPVPSKNQVQYALELPAGAFGRSNAGVGDKLRFVSGNPKAPLPF